MKTCILRGVPSSLRQDGWWLGPITPVRPRKDRPRAAQNPDGKTGRRYALHALLLAGLMALSQLQVQPLLPDTPPEPVTAACGGTDVLGFHAATGLRSLGSAPQQGTAL